MDGLCHTGLGHLQGYCQSLRLEEETLVSFLKCDSHPGGCPCFYVLSLPQTSSWLFWGFPCKGHTGQKYCLENLGDGILSSLVEKKNDKASCTDLLLLTYLHLVMEDS